MKKTMLITGSTRGLGKALKDKFEDRYRVIGVARSGGDFNGDLTDPTFRKVLISEVFPDVVVNNAGVGSSEGSHNELFNLNLVAAIDLTRGFAKKMESGHIINISSVSAGLGLANNIPDVLIDYAVSKKALSDFTQMFQFLQTKDLKICSIEPGFTMTESRNANDRYEQQLSSDYITRRKIKPIDLAYLANVVDWILSQPKEVAVSSIRLMNQCYG